MNISKLIHDMTGVDKLGTEETEARPRNHGPGH